MRVKPRVTSLSWIPSEAAKDMLRMGFSTHVAEYDDPPHRGGLTCGIRVEDDGVPQPTIHTPHHARLSERPCWRRVGLVGPFGSTWAAPFGASSAPAADRPGVAPSPNDQSVTYSACIAGSAPDRPSPGGR
jgi:hypothetical protein